MISRIIISRTDGIGDVVLTLPLAGLLKEMYPNAEIWFIGRSYTEAIVSASIHVNCFINWDKVLESVPSEQERFLSQIKADAIVHVFPNKKIALLAAKVKIPIRIGTSHRVYHLWTCNKWVNLSRKSSPLHEAQLNALLCRPLGIKNTPTLEELIEFAGFSQTSSLDEKFSHMIAADKFNLILHPKSKGSAREWGPDNFNVLIAMLPKENYKIFISGTKEDGLLLKPMFERWGENVTDITGLMSLPQFIAFIGKTDGLIAASTGPLHIAAALGKVAIGLYAPMRPIHPGRWAPLGKKASYLVLDKTCNGCRKSIRCECIERISPQKVLEKLRSLN